MGLRERLTASAAEIRARSQRLVELNIEMLTTELKRKGQQYGTAIGLFVGAGVLALYALGFALTTIAVVLYIWLPLWLSVLIVTAVLALIGLVLALVGRSTLRQAKTPSPERAVREAKSTADALKTNLRKTADDLTPRRNGKVPVGLAAAPSTPPAGPLGGSPTTPPSTPPPPAPPASPPPPPRDVPPSDNEVS
jgi:membrane protein implicated in regulation of membrane protease activity